jgi:hypothetical protein
VLFDYDSFLLVLFMNVVLSGIFCSLAILLFFKTLLVSLANRLLRLKSLKIYVATNIILGLILASYAVSVTDWFYYTGRLTLFVVAVLAVAEALSIVVSGHEKYKSILRFCLERYWLIAIPSMLVLLGLSLFLLSRSFIGPMPDITGCQSIKALSFSCNTLNPEDLVVTPDKKFIVVSEFGGIEPLSRPKAGQLILLEVESKARFPVSISFAENTWGDKQCRRSEDQPMGPHGIDLVQRDDGRFQLAVVSHIPHESVEMFELSKVSDQEAWIFTWRGCVLVPKVNHINDVSLASDGSFYVSHMAPHGFSVADFLVTTITRGNTGYVLRWDSVTGFSQVPASEGGQPNGVVFDESNATLYVAFNLSDRIVAIDLAEGRVLRSYSLDAPDNLVLNDGSIWVTSLEHQILDPMRCLETGPCALPFSVTQLDANSFDVQRQWTFRGEPFGLPTVALPFDLDNGAQQVMLGSFRSDRIAFFDLE